jgi:hypothetical protein
VLPPDQPGDVVDVVEHRLDRHTLPGSQEERNRVDADHAARVRDRVQLLVALGTIDLVQVGGRRVGGDDRPLRKLAGVERSLPAAVAGVDDDAELVHGLDAGDAER